MCLHKMDITPSLNPRLSCVFYAKEKKTETSSLTHTLYTQIWVYFMPNQHRRVIFFIIHTLQCASLRFTCVDIRSFIYVAWVKLFTPCWAFYCARIFTPYWAPLFFAARIFTCAKMLMMMMMMMQRSLRRQKKARAFKSAAII